MILRGEEALVLLAYDTHFLAITIGMMKFEC